MSYDPQADQLLRHPGSFRDPSGFVFIRDGHPYRQVNRRWQGSYDRLMQSGLYARLTDAGQLVPHDELAPPAFGGDEAYKLLKPRRVDFISYPYEWCFSQLKDAALLTLGI